MSKILFSFDIFDTTLVRKCGSPENAFYLLSKSLFPDDDALQTDFFMWRINAEAEAQQKMKKNCLTISDIYSCYLEEEFGYSTEVVIEKELELEANLLTYNSKIKELIALKRAAGYIICFISDMYLPSKFLKNILLREGCAEECDKVFVSCEYGKTKSDGSLYEIVRKDFFSIKKWIHYGDNKCSDLRQARRKGVEAFLVDTDYTKCEKEVIKHYSSFPFAYPLSVLVGYQRCARLHLQYENKDDLCNAADFLPSSYIPYLDYIFQKSQKDGIKRLYFISRDSNILYAMSDLFKKDYPTIECRYLFVSRKSMALANLEDITKEELGYIFNGTDTIIGQNVDVILSTLQISDLNIETLYKKIKSKEEEDDFIIKLRSQKDVIFKRRNDAKEILKCYLTQEGIFDDTTMALVDVGWFGTTRLMINKMRKENGLHNIASFYFGCRKDVLGPEFGKYYTFLPYRFIDSDLTILVESYLSLSEYPSTIGYKINGKNIEPIFANKNVSQHITSLYSLNMLVSRQTLNYIREFSFVDYAFVMQIWSEIYLRLFKNKPELFSYSTFAKLRGVGKDNIIEKLNLFDFMRFLLSGYLNKDCIRNNSMYFSYGFVWKQKWTLFILYDFMSKCKYKLVHFVIKYKKRY